MTSLGVGTEPYVSYSQNEISTITLVAAVISLIWYITVAAVCALGQFEIFRNYSRPPQSPNLSSHPHVTIIRPIKGTEPCLYECLASTLRQSYPKDRLHIRFCISSRTEPSLPILEKLLRDFPDCDAEIPVEDEDELLQHGSLELGPNPKIRNMSRAYREAEGDIAWIIDCNIWVGPQTCARMVSTLDGNKFVHLLPIMVDVSDPVASHQPHNRHRIWSLAGGRLEELFLSTYHPKFYVAINTVAVAPAIIGKSTMFRISHLNSLTHNQGIDYFSYNICEDHLIGDLLWKRKVLSELGDSGEKLGKHALCFGDLAIQPMSDMSLKEYWNRRVRWLRVRKFTVTLASFVEPATESFVCSLYGAFAFTTLPVLGRYSPHSWLAFFGFWLLSVSLWCAMDWRLYNFLHSGLSIQIDEHTPDFARPGRGHDGDRRHTFREWLAAWLGREMLALPVWTWAFWGGTKVEWRGRKFWVGFDTKVHEIKDGVEKTTMVGNGIVANGMANGKDRSD